MQRDSLKRAAHYDILLSCTRSKAPAHGRTGKAYLDDHQHGSIAGTRSILFAARHHGFWRAGGAYRHHGRRTRTSSSMAYSRKISLFAGRQQSDPRTEFQRAGNTHWLSAGGSTRPADI